MVRTYQVDTSVQAHFQSLLERNTLVEVGLLLGKAGVGSGRNVLVARVPAPLKEGKASAATVTLGGAASKVAGAPKKATGATSGPGAVTSVVLDVEWITQHAEQVSRLLPGGTQVLGIYLFASDAGYQAALPQVLTILQALKELHTAQARATAQPQLQPEAVLVLHADSTLRKWTARSSGGSMPVTAAALAVSELKWAPCAGFFMQLQCRWAVEAELPVVAAAAGGGGKSLQGVVEELLVQQRTAIVSALACLANGTVPEPSAVLGELLPTGPSPKGLPALTIQLLPIQGLVDVTPDARGGGAAEGSQAPGGPLGDEAASAVVVGQGSLRGMLAGVAVVHKRQAWSSAVQELQADLVTSLRVRLDLLVEDALSWQDEQQQEHGQGAGTAGDSGAKGEEEPPQHALLSTSGKALSRAFAAGLPSRVQLPSLGGGLPLLDYLLPGDTADDAVARALELVGGALPPALVSSAQQLEARVVSLEGEAAVAKKLFAWTPDQATPAAAPSVTMGVAVADVHGMQRKGCRQTVEDGAIWGAAIAVGLLSLSMGAWTARFFGGMAS